LRPPNIYTRRPFPAKSGSSPEGNSDWFYTIAPRQFTTHFYSWRTGDRYGEVAVKLSVIQQCNI
jgi:hypothetical protein